jgi:hypothetical protein
MSESAKVHLKMINTGKKMSTDTYNKMLAIAEFRKNKPGKLHSEETKEKLRLINLGKKYGPRSQETKNKISLALKGKSKIR